MEPREAGRRATSTRQGGLGARRPPARHLLLVDGRLCVVVDFGGLNVGDPACDLQPAWNVFDGGSRDRFRAELEADDGSWLRGRGWALCQAVSALPHYWDTNPGMIRQASHALAEVLGDSAG